MTRYIAFLRAINVGGTTLIKMADLKRMFESFGLENVQTYIQSGNVIFESSEADATALEEQIERQLEKAVGKRIQLFVRTMREVTAILRACPFEPKEGETVYIVILDKKPSKKNVDALLAFRSKFDDFAVKGREGFQLRRDREKTTFTNRSMEQVLGVPGTARNLNTIKALIEKYR
jgi:uncharacterized protein (DUF1697 family)